MTDVITDPPIAPPTDKPGWTTTEFWLTASSTVLAFITALLALTTPGFSLDPLISAAVAAFAPVAAMVGNGFYALSRSRTKQATAAVAVEKMQLDYDRQEKQKAWDIAVAYKAMNAPPRKMT